MKKIISTLALGAILVLPSVLSADSAKGLNVLINSPEPQTQAMAMVLSMMTIKQHKKEVSIVLCGAAGDLADKNIKSAPVKRPDGSEVSPQQNLQMLIKMGAKVEVCPLYLPNASKDASVLLEGVTVAKPPMVAGNLLNKDYQNLSF
jgi:predicted peroxiredoxin